MLLFVCGRRDICQGQNPVMRREPATDPAIPTRRSSRRCVARTTTQGAGEDMASEEATDETRTGDEYLPGKSST